MERRKQVKGLLVPRSLSCEHRLFLTLYKSKNCRLVLSLSLSFFAFLVCFVVVDEGWGIFILDTNMITYVDVLVSPVNFMKNKSRLSFTVLWKTFTVIIRWNFSFFSLAVSQPHDLQIIFCSCVNETKLFSFLRSLLGEDGRSHRFLKVSIKKQTRWSNDKTIIERGRAKYRDLSVSRRSIIKASTRQLIDLLATDKWRYFAQPCPIVVNYSCLRGCMMDSSILVMFKSLKISISYRILTSFH